MQDMKRNLRQVKKKISTLIIIRRGLALGTTVRPICALIFNSVVDGNAVCVVSCHRESCKNENAIMFRTPHRAGNWRGEDSELALWSRVWTRARQFLFRQMIYKLQRRQ